MLRDSPELVDRLLVAVYAGGMVLTIASIAMTIALVRRFGREEAARLAKSDSAVEERDATGALDDSGATSSSGLRAPAVELERPRWRSPEFFLGLTAWIVPELLIGGLVFEISRQYALLLREQLASPAVAYLASSALSAGIFVPIALAMAFLIRISATLVCLAVIAAHGQRPSRVLGLDGARWVRGFRQGIAVFLVAIWGCLGFQALWVAVLEQLGMSADPQLIVEEFRASVEAGEWLRISLIAATGAIAAPIFEEVLFRGLLYRWLAARAGTAVGIVVSALLFSAIHLNLAASGAIFVLGVLLALLYHRTGNLWACIAFHAAFNGSQFVVLTLIASQT